MLIIIELMVGGLGWGAIHTESLAIKKISYFVRYVGVQLDSLNFMHEL